jgi:hypothetical protein
VEQAQEKVKFLGIFLQGGKCAIPNYGKHNMSIIIEAMKPKIINIATNFAIFGNHLIFR